MACITTSHRLNFDEAALEAIDRIAKKLGTTRELEISRAITDRVLFLEIVEGGGRVLIDKRSNLRRLVEVDIFGPRLR